MFLNKSRFDGHLPQIFWIKAFPYAGSQNIFDKEETSAENLIFSLHALSNLSLIYVYTNLCFWACLLKAYPEKPLL